MTKREFFELTGNSRLKVPNEPEFPDGSQVGLSWFFALEPRRQSSMDGPQPLSTQEIEGFLRLTGAEMAPEDAEIVFALDAAYLPAIRSLISESGDIKSEMQQIKRGG